MQKGKFLRKFSHRRNYPAFSFGLRLFQSSHLKIKIKLPHFGFASKNETQSRHSQIGEKNETKYTSNSTKSKNVEKRKIKDWKYSFTAEQQALHLKLLSLSEAIAGSEDKSEMGKGEKKKIKESGEVAHFNIEFTETMRYIEDLHAIENDTEEDDEIKLLAKEELKEKKKFLGDLQEQVIDALVDEYIQIQNENISSTECVVEIKQAMGGSESSLFCHLLMNMYQQFTQQMGWKWKEEFIMEDQAIGKGLKHGKFIITSQSHDDSPFNYFQHESGVHK
jgi:protein subunit release factor A